MFAILKPVLVHSNTFQFFRAGKDHHSDMLIINGKPTARDLTEIELTIGQNASLICPIGGYPLVSATWKKEGGNLTGSNLMEKTIQVEDDEDYFRTDLVFEKIKPENEGTYECTIDHVTAKIKLTVTNGNQIFFI